MLSKEITTGGFFRENTAEELSRTAGQLKDIYINHKKHNINPQQLADIRQLLLKAQDGLANGESTAEYLKGGDENIHIQHKNGGILKFQAGGSGDIYMKKHGLGKYQGTSQAPSVGAPKNISNLIRGASKMDQSIIGANALSLAPG